MTIKVLALQDFLTQREIEKCVREYRRDPYGFVKWCETHVVKPNLPRINTSLGQENDARYIAYCITYIIGKALDRSSTNH